MNYTKGEQFRTKRKDIYNALTFCFLPLTLFVNVLCSTWYNFEIFNQKPNFPSQGHFDTAELLQPKQCKLINPS